MKKTISVHTHATESMINITREIATCIREEKCKNGIAHIFVPHTTAAITINENADPDVVTDMLHGINAIVPNLNFKHCEGNSRAHIKSSMIGVSLQVAIQNGQLALGTWQGIYFCEFDGPRSRTVWVTILNTDI